MEIKLHFSNTCNCTFKVEQKLLGNVDVEKHDIHENREKELTKLLY